MVAKLQGSGAVQGFAFAARADFPWLGRKRFKLKLTAKSLEMR